MSFLLGSLSGALVAGGIYYGFSNSIQTRTKTHTADLHVLSHRLLNPPSSLVPPTPAAERIYHDPFTSYMKERWNEEVKALFRSTVEWSERGRQWGKNHALWRSADVDS